MEWYLKVLRNYVTFTGRAGRREFWMFTLFNLIAIMVLGLIDGLLGTNGKLQGLYGLAVLLPSLAVTVRRLHDTDRSGWWVLITLVPIIGGLTLLIFTVLEGDRGANRFGDEPSGGVPPLPAD